MKSLLYTCNGCLATDIHCPDSQTHWTCFGQHSSYYEEEYIASKIRHVYIF
jgi:hypothetical protein